MYGLEVRSRPNAPERRTRAELANLGAYLQWVWPALPAPMTLGWSDSLVITLDHGRPWIYGPAERDPLRGSRGGSVLPQRVRRQLKKIARLGVPFQRLAIAHELAREGAVSDLLPALEEGPRTCTDELARVLVGDIPAHPGVSRAVRVLDGAVAGATFAASLPASLVSSVLDPIVFGIVAPQPPQHGELCLWYPLAAWRW
jgi:hypothetical protein